LATALAFSLEAAAAESAANSPRSIDVRASTDPFARIRQSMAWEIALVPHTGPGKSDEQIAKTQAAVRAAADPRPQLERLGWLLVAKARASNDAGVYKLAEQCALAIDAHGEKNPGALLLRGHIAQSLHRFKEAEAIARQLTAERELAFDYGLLGDALADQGKLDEAIRAYQRMVDLRPELQSYGRVAHVRWIRGDLTGAIAAAELAAGAASPQIPEPAAWAYTRLATFHVQAGSAARAEAACVSALQFIPEHAPALLLQGRLRLAAGETAEAVNLLRRAAAKNPLPEYQWTLADALRAAGLVSEADTVGAELARTGVASDPRTFALYLATRGQRPGLALRLATAELKERADVFTYDAVAWAQTASGDHAAAWSAMERALAEGTKDARLFLHAGVIAARLGRSEAADWLQRARTLEALLLPSEREHLAAAAKLLPPKIAAAQVRR
jgi:tetratricopeptide (TPR) repeat protein